MEVVLKWAAEGNWNAFVELAQNPLIRWAMLFVAITVVNQMVVTSMADLLLGVRGGIQAISPEYRQAAQIYVRRNGTALTRTVLALVCASYFFVVNRLDVSWFDVLYRNGGSATTEMTQWLPMYCELQLARLVFTAFITPDISFSWIAAAVIRGTHVIVALMLVFIQSVGKQTPSLVYFALLAQMDLLDVLDNFKLTGTMPFLQRLLTWRLVGYVWFVFRLLIPAYAIWTGRLGMFAGRLVFGLVIAFQLIVWLMLPVDPPAYGDHRRSVYDQRIHRGGLLTQEKNKKTPAFF